MGAWALFDGRNDYARCAVRGQRQGRRRALPLRGVKPAHGGVAEALNQGAQDGRRGGARAGGTLINPRWGRVLAGF